MESDSKKEGSIIAMTIWKLKKAFMKWMGNMVFFLVVILAFSFTITGVVTGKPSIFGKFMPMWVVTDSMEPVLPVGSLIIGEPIRNIDEIQVGDIVAYKAGEYRITPVIVHRVIEITEEGYIFKGDNNKFTDSLVKSEQMLYKISEP